MVVLPSECATAVASWEEVLVREVLAREVSSATSVSWGEAVAAAVSSCASALFGVHRQHARTSKQHNASVIALFLAVLLVALSATQVAALLAAQVTGFATNLP